MQQGHIIGIFRLGRGSGIEARLSYEFAEKLPQKRKILIVQIDCCRIISVVW